MPSLFVGRLCVLQWQGLLLRYEHTFDQSCRGKGPRVGHDEYDEGDGAGQGHMARGEESGEIKPLRRVMHMKSIAKRISIRFSCNNVHFARAFFATSESDGYACFHLSL